MKRMNLCTVLFLLSIVLCILENGKVSGELNSSKNQINEKSFRGKVNGIERVGKEFRGHTLFFGDESYLQQSNASLNPMITSGYLFSSMCFMYSIKGLSSQNLGYKSNIAGLVGMTTGIFVTMSDERFGGHYVIFILTILISGGIGIYIADKTDLIRMPQLVAIFHSLIGLSAILVSYSFFYTSLEGSELVETSVLRRIEIFVGGAMGMFTFIGSVIAAMKLDDIIPSNSAKIPYKNTCLMMILISLLITGIGFCSTSNQVTTLTNLHSGMILSALLGTFIIISIGGADMPVIISMLNSYSGWSTAITGFLLDNTLLIVSGALIGSSGAILSYIMCKEMNRTFLSVIMGGFDQIETSDFKDALETVNCSTITPLETTNLLLSSSKVLIVPGYGMAVSKSHTCISEIMKLLELNGCRVDICVHPVAGRMPGHMNVLLAEADVPTKAIKEMEQVNEEMEDYDLVLIVGANDIVNPAALSKQSKIYGMKTIFAWKARQVIVSKRSLGHGYACIENELFTESNTKMLLGDSRKTLNLVENLLKGEINHNKFTSNRNVDVNLLNKEVKPETLEFENMSDETSPLISSLNEQKEKIEETEQHEGKNTTKKVQKRIAILPTVDEDDENGSTIIFPIPPSEICKFRKKGYGVGLSKECINSYLKNIYFSEEDYVKGGAFVYENTEEMMRESEIVVKLGKPTIKEANTLKKGQILICNMCVFDQSQISDRKNKKDKLLTILNNKGVTVLDLDRVPRTSNAQTMDVRTTLSNISGYRAVVEAMNYLPRISKSMSSAAGVIKQSTVLVIGVGIAGLQAIATAKSMGTKVIAMDKRSASKDEAESCGARFVKLPDSDLNADGSDNGNDSVLSEQRKIIESYLKNADIVITCASVLGTAPPVLITKEAIKKMKQGSVIVDLCTDFGGNCEISERNRVITDKESGLTIVGKSNFLFSMPLQSSELFSGNIYSLLTEMGKTAHVFKCDLDNDIIRKICLSYEGKMQNGEKTINDETRTEKQNANNTSLETSTISDSTITTASNTVSSSLISIQNYLDSEDESCEYDDKTIAEIRSTKDNITMNSKLFIRNYVIPNGYFLISMVTSILMFVIMGINMNIVQIYNIFSFIVSIIIGYYCIWEVDSKLHTPLMSITNALSGVIIIGSMAQYGTQTISANTLMTLAATFLSSINTFGGFYVTNRMLTLFKQ